MFNWLFFKREMAEVHGSRTLKLLIKRKQIRKSVHFYLTTYGWFLGPSGQNKSAVLAKLSKKQFTNRD